MKESKAILTRHLVLSLILQALAVIIIALPPLEPYRVQVANLTQIPVSALWIPILGIFLIINYFILRRIGQFLVAPSEELVNQTKLGASSFAFKKKSKNAEEDHLKHFIESICVRSVGLEQELNRMENEIERMNDAAKISPDEIDQLRGKVDKAEAKSVESAKLLATEQERSTRLEKELAASKRELKHALRELEEIRDDFDNRSAKTTKQELEVVSAGEPTSILVERLRNPLNLINNLSWRLAKSWADTPPSQIREGLQEICKQSEEQLELLKKYRVTERSDDEEERDAL